MADPRDIQGMKLAIAHQVAPAYQPFRQANVTATKHPGSAVYMELTNQVFDKYKTCLQQHINGKVISNGKNNFAYVLGTCIENLCREYNKSAGGSAPKRAKVGRGIVGVLPEQYAPQLTNAEKIEQGGQKDYLKNIHTLGSAFWDWDEIRQKLTESFKLQREEIVTAREIIERATNDDDGDENVHLEERAISKLKADWPFLFEPSGLTIHHNIVSGRDIETQMNKFIEEDLEMMIGFLTTQSEKSIKNLKLKAKLDKLNIAKGKKVLAMVEMLANHFRESFRNMVLTTEVQYEV